jgi:hypothetical protein
LAPRTIKKGANKCLLKIGPSRARTSTPYGVPRQSENIWASKRKDKGRLPDFVLVFRETIRCEAWKALSFGARSLYIALKARVPKMKNCAFLSYRDALADLGRKSHKKIAQWFLELQHYGFVVMERHGSLGVDGRGKSPLWRLTELPNHATGEPATKDYLRWDGVIFEAKTERPCPYPRRNKRRPLVVTSMRTTEGTVKTSPMCTTQGTLPAQSAETQGTVVSPRREHSVPAWGTGFQIPPGEIVVSFGAKRARV